MHGGHAGHQGQPGAGADRFGFLDEAQARIVPATVPQHMKVGRQVIEKKRNSVRLARLRRRLRPCVATAIRRRITASSASSVRLPHSACGQRRVGCRNRAELLGRQAQHAAAPRMGVLHVEHRIFAGLRDHEIEIELHLGVGFADQHGEAHGVAADFLDQVAQGDEAAGALAHLAPARRRAARARSGTSPPAILARVGQRAHGRAHAGNIAAVIGAPDVDHELRAARHLVRVVGDVVGEIGVAAVAFAQRAIDVVAELGGAEQGLGAGLPVVRGFAACGGSSTPS